MTKYILIINQALLLNLIIYTPLFSQTVISGTVYSKDTKETLIGAQIQIPQAEKATITDINGQFKIEVDLLPPIVLRVQMLGYDSLYWNIVDNHQDIELEMLPKTLGEHTEKTIGKRIDDNILYAPNALKQLDFMDIMMNPNNDFYTGLGMLEGVQVYHSSFGFTPINTRGFADILNNRLVQLVDGVDVSVPGLNAPIGNAIGPSELDIEKVELVAGPGSALYSANAFNGLLQIKTRDIEDYPGFSAYFKQGAILQEDIGSRLFTDLGFRYALNKGRFGAKFSLSYLNADDLIATDYDFTPIAPSFDPNEFINNQARNIYGDASVVRLPNGLFINRSGFREEDLIDDKVDNLRANVLFQYKIKDDLKLIYDTRMSRMDYVNRVGSYIAVEDELILNQRLELRGKDFFVRSYVTDIIDGESLDFERTGNKLQETLIPDDVWAARFFNAWSGAVPGTPANDVEGARIFADLPLPDPRTDEFINTLEEVKRQDNSASGIQANRSSFWHVEGQYDIVSSEATKKAVQIGGSFRRYNLLSGGSLFNDGPNSNFADGINIWEAGGFLLATQELLNERLTLYGSLRFDAHQDFPFRVSPKIASTIKLDRRNNHNLRVQGQVGFRNPVPSEMFIFAGVQSTSGPLIIGGTERNLEALQVEQTSGREIFSNLVSLESFTAFQRSGGQNPAILDPANLELLEREQVQTIELGYRGLVNNTFFIDVNAYLSSYRNFSRSSFLYSQELLSPIVVTNNIGENILGWGSGIILEYNFPKKYKIQANYTYADTDLEIPTDEDLSAISNELPSLGFNAPNHSYNISLNNRDVFKGLGFSLQYQWWDSYVWKSALGTADIPSTGIFNAALSVKLRESPILIKVVGSNLLNRDFNTVIGGPSIGAQYHVSVTFDKFFW